MWPKPCENYIQQLTGTWEIPFRSLSCFYLATAGEAEPQQRCWSGCSQLSHVLKEACSGAGGAAGRQRSRSAPAVGCPGGLAWQREPGHSAVRAGVWLCCSPCRPSGGPVLRLLQLLPGSLPVNLSPRQGDLSPLPPWTQSLFRWRRRSEPAPGALPEEVCQAAREQQLQRPDSLPDCSQLALGGGQLPLPAGAGWERNR